MSLEMENKRHPVIEAWFARKFGIPTNIQSRAWKEIDSGRHTLIASPTGTGKTLAAMLPCLDRIVSRKAASAASGANSGVRVLYITPLKALNNDIHHHMFDFAGEMEAVAGELGLDWPGIRIGIRTGDTTANTRASMIRKPPDLLVTTPESFYLLMTSVRAREMLKTVEQIIVDEIHDLAADKRGAHLSLTLERLVEWCGIAPQRIGVSATQKPLELVAAFLGGWEYAEQSEPRAVSIVESKVEKRIELSVELMDSLQLGRGRTQEHIWGPIAERIVKLMDGSATTLVFVNNRRLCERLTLHINEQAGWEMARSHHGSVSRETRLAVEDLLKSGELRCLVATSSLELGIDVGHVDLVIQVDSPKSAAAGIQRIGRAGHSVGSPSRGVMLLRGRGELAEAAVLARQIAARDIEAIRLQRHALDVLAQQVVAMVATDDWELDRLFAVVSRSECYRGFPRERLTAMVQVLAGFYPFARPLIEWDRGTGLLRRRGNTAMSALTGAGTIPSSSAFAVHHADSRLHLGELEEEYVHESRSGDVFQLGTSSWRIESIQHDKVYVTEAANRFSEIPFWRGDALGRSFELGEQIGRFLHALEERISAESDSTEADRLEADAAKAEGTAADAAEPADAVIEWVKAKTPFDEYAARSLTSYVKGQRHASGLPTHRKIVVECYVDEVKQMHVVFHSLFGRLMNHTWMMAIRRRLEQALPHTVYGAAKDNGIEFVLPEWNESWLNAMLHLTPGEVRTLLYEALPGSPMFAAVFRKQAETALLLSRGFNRVPAWQKRLRSEQLLKDALLYAEQFPLLRTAVEECFERYLDVPSLEKVLDAIETGEIAFSVVRSSIPSPFAMQYAFDFVNAKMYETDAVGGDLQFQLMGITKQMAAEAFGESSLGSRIAVEAMEQERQRLEGRPGREGKPVPAPDRDEAYPDVARLEGTGQEEAFQLQSADALLRFLKERGDKTASELKSFAGPQLDEWLRKLETGGKTVEEVMQGEKRWICADETDLYAGLHTDRACRVFILQRYIDQTLSFTADDLVNRYAIHRGQADDFIGQAQNQAAIEPAPFAQSGEEPLWSSRKITSRLIRYTMKHMQAQVEAIDPQAYAWELAARHGMLNPAEAGETQKLEEALDKLQGWFFPVAVWETVILPARVKGYRKEMLDLLCASGQFFWIGRKEQEDKEGAVAFFRTENKALFAPYLKTIAEEKPEQDSKHPELLRLIRDKGASFLTALCRDMDAVPSELVPKLLDLVWEGHISNDQLAPVRLNTGKKSGTGKNDFRSGLGRWYPLHSMADAEDQQKSLVEWAHRLAQSRGVISKTVLPPFFPFSWDTVAAACRRLEDLGVLTRGVFVREMASLQFADKETASAFRRLSKSSSVFPNADQEPLLLAAIDPANPYGSFVAWPDFGKSVKFARKAGNFLVMAGGIWTLWVEGYGKNITVLGASLDSADPEFLAGVIKRVAVLVIKRHQLKKFVIQSWNNRPLAESEIAAQLQKCGAETDRSSLVFWPSSLN